MSIADIIDNKGNSLLHHAAVNGNYWVFNSLVEYWKS
jgi:ankyrin repeat protein